MVTEPAHRRHQLPRPAQPHQRPHLRRAADGHGGASHRPRLPGATRSAAWACPRRWTSSWRSSPTVPLRFQPGTAYQYSLATDACGALVEKISGVPFAEYLQEHILDPLGMVDTSFQVPADKAHRFAANYQRNPDKTTTLIDDPATSVYLRAAGVRQRGRRPRRHPRRLRHASARCSASGGELDGHRIIGPRTLELMRRNHLPGGKDLADARRRAAHPATATSASGSGSASPAPSTRCATGALPAGRLLLGRRGVDRVLGGPASRTCGWCS